MNKPFELKVIVELVEELVEELSEGCSDCAFHRSDICGKYDCKDGIFKVIGVVEERKEEV